MATLDKNRNESGMGGNGSGYAENEESFKNRNKLAAVSLNSSKYHFLVPKPLPGG
jgi:hypothetical protein